MVINPNPSLRATRLLGGIHYAWVIVAILVLVQFVGSSISMSAGIIVPLLKDLQGSFGWSIGTIGAALMMYYLVGAAFAPSSGCRLAGAAWSGEDEVVKVEISTDGGASWRQADVVRPRHGYSWYRWTYYWRPPASGRYTLMSRATNDKGETQPAEFRNRWDGLGYGNNMIFPVEVEVRER